MSTFSGDIGREEEDGGGWGGLVPDKDERRLARLAKKLSEQKGAQNGDPEAVKEYQKQRDRLNERLKGRKPLPDADPPGVPHCPESDLRAVKEYREALEGKPTDLIGITRAAFDGLVDNAHWLTLERERLTIECEWLREALTKLRNEVLGLLGIAGVELRAKVGNSNMHCLQIRLDEALSALRGAQKGASDGK